MKHPRSAFADAALVAGGMCVFALFAHRPVPLVYAGAVGLVVTGLAVSRTLRSDRIAHVFGLRIEGIRTWLALIPACALGMALGVVCRIVWNQDPFPRALGLFAPMAVLIGVAEEVMYRGYVQGRLSSLGVAPAIILAAAAHAAYKVVLFCWTPVPMDVGPLLMFNLTFLGGVAFGVLCRLGRSVVPAAVAHGLFDLLVYGSLWAPCWWVWC